MGARSSGKSLAAEISLVEELRSGGYEASVITTYNAYLPFYEEVVLRRLVAAGCRHNVVLMDHGQCVQALLDPSYKPNGAGTQYTLVPMRVPGSFHPKIAFLAGPKRALALVGSHNLTISGFGYNREISNRMEAAKAGDAEAIRALGTVWGAVAAWIRSQGRVLPKEVMEAALAVGNAVQWIREERAPADTPFLASAPGRPSLWEQLRPRIPFKAKRIAVLGPFFDEDFSFLERLSRDLAPKEIAVAVEPETVALGDPKRLPDRTHVVDAKKLGRRRGYLHAKAVLCESADGNVVLATGSANPGFSAWLAPGMQRNAEAVVVRTGSAARRAAAELGLSDVFEYPGLTTKEMAGIAAERKERSRAEVPAVPVVVAVEGPDGFRAAYTPELEGVQEAHLLGAGRADLGKALRLSRHDDALLVPVPDRATRAAVRELSLVRKRGPAVLALVHHVEEIAERARTGRQAQFRAALASLSGATPDLAKLITLVGDIIFDSETEVAGRASARTDRERNPREREQRPDSLGVSMDQIARKRAVHRLIRSGDFGYLLDVLIHRLGIGLETRREEVDHLGRSEEEQRNQDDEPAAAAHVLSDKEVAATCRRKVRTLVSRMARQLERAATGESDARLALAQLLAVLATVRELRTHEQQARWRSIAEPLIYEEDRGELLASSLAYLYGRRYALMKKTIAAAATDEQPDEVQRLPGLLLWLAWDCGLRLDERAIFGEEPEAARERTIHKAMLLAISPAAADNPIAREEAEKSVLKTARASQAASAQTWLTSQLAWGQRVRQAAESRSRRVDGKPRIGDLAFIAADGASDLYVVSTASAGYIGLVDLSDPDTEARFLPDRIATISELRASSLR